MKKQLIVSLLVVFALGVFAPAVVNAMDNDVQIVKVDGEEKKADTKKADTKKEGECTSKTESKKEGACCSEKKESCCSSAKSSDCKSTCTDKKAEKK